MNAPTKDAEVVDLRGQFPILQRQIHGKPLVTHQTGLEGQVVKTLLVEAGSDIGGSVRNPAAWCNIVGHRPTTWMIPDIPNPRLWQNMNTPGPMARTVSDVALFLSALAGPDPRCPVPIPAPFPPGACWPP